MLTLENYIIAWLVYLLASAGLLSVVWRSTGHLGRMEWRNLLRCSAVVLLLFPYTADPEQSYLAPGLLIALLEGVFQGVEGLQRAGLPLLVAWIFALVISMALEIWWRQQWLQRHLSDALEQERQQLLQESLQQPPLEPETETSVDDTAEVAEDGAIAVAEKAAIKGGPAE